MKYKIGQILTANKDIEVETLFSKKTIRKGSKAIVCADGFVKHDNGMLRPVNQDEVVGDCYDLNGIATWIYLKLYKDFELKEFMEEYEIDQNDFVEAIEWALYDIGLKVDEE